MNSLKMAGDALGDAQHMLQILELISPFLWSTTQFRSGQYKGVFWTLDKKLYFDQLQEYGIVGHFGAFNISLLNCRKGNWRKNDCISNNA